MSETAIVLLRPERVMVTSYNLTQIDKFIGYDEGRKSIQRELRSLLAVPALYPGDD